MDVIYHILAAFILGVRTLSNVTEVPEHVDQQKGSTILYVVYISLV